MISGLKKKDVDPTKEIERVHVFFLGLTHRPYELKYNGEVHSARSRINFTSNRSDQTTQEKSANFTIRTREPQTNRLCERMNIEMGDYVFLDRDRYGEIRYNQLIRHFVPTLTKRADPSWDKLLFNLLPPHKCGCTLGKSSSQKKSCMGSTAPSLASKSECP